MSKIKKRTRKHNPLRVDILRLERALKNFCIININNNNGICKLIKFSGEEVPVTQGIHQALTLTRFNWSIYMAGFGINGSENYTKSSIAISPHPYLQSELIEFLNDEHQKLLRGFNPEHLCGFGWLASPTGHDFTEKEAYRIFDMHGAFKE
jgi:hypothetical protein